MPEEFVGLFRADAIWTTGHGKRLTGRDEISSFTHQVLPGAMKDSTATYEVVHVLFIRPDLAAIKAHALREMGHQVLVQPCALIGGHPGDAGA
ncbi:SgcJ/EcaC family oxidoreductase [Streptomyces sp. NPDC003635]